MNDEVKFMKERQTIIYILSNQRSGSTLIENILSKSSQMVSVGESYLLGSYIQKIGPGSAWDWNCSCGSSLVDCDFWKKVYAKLKISNPKEINNTKIMYPTGKEAVHQKIRNKEVVTLMNKIYGAVFEITNCEVLVDSSKEAFYGTTLYQDSPYNFKFIHLRRDLRAVTLSKQKWRKKYNKKHVGLIKLLLANYVHRLKCKYMLRNVQKKDIFNLNYEDFFLNPQYSLDEMSHFFGFDSFSMPDYMELQNDHTVAGTPNRFQKRKIQYDNQWEQGAKKFPLFNILGTILNKLG